MKKKLLLGLGIPLSAVITAGVVTCICLSSLNVFNNSCKYLGKKAKLEAYNSNIRDYVYNSDEFEEYVKSINPFTAKFVASAFDEFDDKKENLVISPSSLYFSLAMAGVSSSNDTRNQIYNALNNNEEKITKNIGYLYNELNETFYNSGFINEHEVGQINISNSIWVNKNIDVNQSSLDVLNNKYYSDVFRADFSHRNRTNRYISNYIKNQTNKMIDKDYDFDESTFFVILSTLYAKDNWNLFGRPLSTSELANKFLDRNNSSQSLTFYKDGDFRQGSPYIGDEFKVAKILTDNGIAINFFVPDSGIDVSSIFTEENINKFLMTDTKYLFNDEINKIHYYTKVHFPEFKAYSDLDLSRILKSQFGLSDMFDSDKADFSKLLKDKAFIETVNQTTNIIVDKKGLKGASATAVIGAGAAGPDAYTHVYQDFVVDRAFGYLVTYGDYVPLFAGITNRAGI